MLGESPKQKFFRWVIFSLFAILFFRLFQLQILGGSKYAQLSQGNAARIIPVLAPRGIIYDRYHKPVVTNRVIFGVYLLPHLLTGNDREETINRVSSLVMVPVFEIESLLKAARLRSFEPVLIKDNLSLKIVTRIEEQRGNLKAVAVRSRPTRNYLPRKAAVHVLGYVQVDHIGKMGLEKVYDDYLQGVDGGQKLEIDVYGTPVRIVESTDPVPGNNLLLTLDLDLQLEVESLLVGKQGAVVVLNPNTGEILAMASSPTYDPDIFSSPLQQSDWKKLETSTAHPFMNRALSPYPPGSIFKPITLYSVLESGLAATTEAHNCPGYYLLGSRKAGCWREAGHGLVDPLEGLVWSCDVVFYEMGKRAGPKILADYARRFGLGSKSGIDLMQEKQGLVPDEWWKKKALGSSWYPGDSINMGIGQGFLQVTPLQMALVYGTLATAKKVKPYLVQSVLDIKGKKLLENKSEAQLIGLDEQKLEFIRTALRDVVRRGTGVAARVLGLPTAGKTGTAENPGLPHAWFLGYAPYDEPEIVVSVFVAHGEHGDQVAARIAGRIFEWYRDNRLIRKYNL